MARIGTDWQGLAGIGMDWQIDEFVSERKIDPRLAQDWHGLAWIGMDWHGLAQDWQGLARIGKMANLCRNQELTPDSQGIGMD